MKPIRIGTRESELALWQAKSVKYLLQDINLQSELIPIKSEGDVDLITPLYELGVQGVFTRSLDIALLNHNIDIAVHSLKDVPTLLPKGIVQAAVLPRGNYRDLLVLNDARPWYEDKSVSHTIASGSIRRRAQWLHRYPKDKMTDLRGNVNTRLNKLYESDWSGAIMAAAGLERIGLKPSTAQELDWMLPAPAQGAIAIMCRSEDVELFSLCHKLNDEPTEKCTGIERDFLRELMGGCSVPISALALCDKKEFYFRGSIFSADGKVKAEVERFVPLENHSTLGQLFANELLKKGGREIAAGLKK